MENEEWKDIKGYEGLYKVSNLGRVYSLYKNKVMKTRISTNGYIVINLYKDGKFVTHRVHRLVALNFIDKRETDEVLIVNHEDGDKSNNQVGNLKWVTYSENKKHAIEMGLFEDNVEGLLRSNRSRMKKVAIIKDNKILKVSECSRDLAEWVLENNLGIKGKKETVGRSIRKKMNDGKSYYGYYFQKVD